MAVFSNQATLTYNGIATPSNIAYGEILDVLTATKTAVDTSFTEGDLLTYVVTVRNSGTSAASAVTVTDDLGGYTFGTTTVYPLTAVADSVRVFVDGVEQTGAAVTAGPPLTVSGITIPGGGDAVILYQARANSFANPGVDGSVVNTATVTGGGLTTPVTATTTLNATDEAVLSIDKSISPAQVVDNELVTYTFAIQNTGNTAVTAADTTTVTDTFSPLLTGITATLNGAPFTQYTYSETTGLFETTAGAITVPAATVTQNATTGEYTLTPGLATLTVTGTI